MSSGVILNGGCAAESFNLGTVEGHREDPSGETYDECWEPEDLVATVQFLATLDDRLHVMPSSSPDEPDPVVVLSPFCPNDNSNNSTNNIISTEENDEADVGNLGGTMDTTSSSVEVEANEPLLLPSSTTLHSFGDASAPSVALSDITAEENSVSSAAQTPSSIEERSIIRTSNKPAHLKRVSFGSTKGSMVETLIYENPHSDEGTSATPSGWNKTNVSVKSKNLRSVIGSVPESLPEETVALLSESARSASKVRVTYFESKRPLTLPSPEASDAEWDDMAEPPPQQQQLNYTRQTSTESGQDNPFRPDGDLSREADELVELLRGGRVSISEVLKNKEGVPLQSQPTFVDDEQQQQQQQSPEQAVQLSGSPPRNVSTPSSPPTSKAESPDGGRINGNLTEQEKKAAEAAESGAIEVQRGVVAPVAGESQVEHVVIKKKSKCQCCVIQ
ncbi:uncharacterized protein LOC124337486 [Daphnia pulicaria]|uniref:uncharacterized protein LOC124337486 n=1 Tax=Daphnia pulicaria TaxID=35523 RepID=UPI001EEC1F91|nr:uncharacterized protein LOC124337486 [Daphnia pulicaria]